MTGLSHADLPGLFDAADQASLRGQRQYIWVVRVRLGLAVLAASGVLVTWQVGTADTDVVAIITAVLLAVIAFTELFLRTTKPAEQWYDGRALAESAKSLAWKYSMRAVPFAAEPDEDAAERRFIEAVETLLHDAPTVWTHPTLRPVVSERMRQLRDADLDARKSVYRTGRIMDQRAWYAQKARQNTTNATLWQVALLSIEVAGVSAAMMQAVGIIAIDLAAVLAAVITAGIAWVGLRQYTTLSRAYTLPRTTWPSRRAALTW